MPGLDPDLRRTWLFGPGADRTAHEAMLASGADALIVDLEDFTPPPSRDQARGLLAAFVKACRDRGRLAAVRINALEADGMLDLEAAMRAQPDVIAYPMADRPAQMHALDTAITHWEHRLGLPANSTEILPVCETALGVVDVRAIAASSARIHCALLGAEDLANDLCAERGPDGAELEYARRRFIVECRAARIEPIDAPYTFSDSEGAGRETRFSRRLGYRSKSLVLSEHAAVLNAVLTPDADELRRARIIVDSFDAARARGEDRVLVEGLWVEVPTYRNARRLLERATRLSDAIRFRP
jgi:citrate lyase subunit beta/citryl-CoA lyase